MFGKDRATARARRSYSLLESAQFASNIFNQVASSATLRRALRVKDGQQDISVS